MCGSGNINMLIIFAGAVELVAWIADIRGFQKLRADGRRSRAAGGILIMNVGRPDFKVFLDLFGNGGRIFADPECNVFERAAGRKSAHDELAVLESVMFIFRDMICH